MGSKLDVTHAVEDMEDDDGIDGDNKAYRHRNKNGRRKSKESVMKSDIEGGRLWGGKQR